MGLENAGLENDANCEHNYGVWKMQEYKFNLPIQCTSKKLYAIHFKVAQT